MSIGGSDVVLFAPARESVADAILHACRRQWPQRICQFQDAQEPTVHPFSDAWVWIVGTSRKEFSVYRDAAAVASWQEQGATRENANTMFHFIIGEPMATEPSLIEVAMLFDRPTPSVRAFIKSLQAAFLSLMVQTPIPEAA